MVDASSTLCVGSASGSAVITIRPKPILSSNASPVLNTICEGTSTTITCTNATNSLGSPSNSALHNNNFNSTIGSEWSFSALVPANVPVIKDYNGGKVLGYLGNQQATFSLTGLPSHDMIQVDFDLYIHDTWDGNDLTSGPDVWKMDVNGSNVINTTFSNFAYRTQAYPNNVSAINPAFSSSLSSVLVNACNFGGGAPSAKYHISKTVPHTANTLTLVLEALGLEDVCNESWSIDNFDVQYRTQSPVSNIVWTNPAVTSTAITVSPIVNTYFVATLGTCSDSIQIIVNPTPRADFSINTANQCVSSNSFNYTNTSTLAGPGGMTHAWTMVGAASTSATTNDIVGNSYAYYGNYNVQLVETSIIGNCSDSRGIKTKTVIVDPAVVITSSLPNPVCVGSTAILTANQVLATGVTLVYTPSYSNNFETAIGSPWTFSTVIPDNIPAIKNYNGTNVLGYLANQQATYTQTGLGTSHSFVKIEFDLYIHDSWDGNDITNGIDRWKMDVDGVNQINTTFSNFTYRTQNYPSNSPANNLNGTGAVSSVLPSACNHASGATGTSLYHISKTIAHTTNDLTVILEGLGLEDVCNESWSIDNFVLQVGANAVSQTLLSACDLLTGPAGPAVYTPNSSNDFNTAIGASWTFSATVPANIPTIQTYNGGSVLGYLSNQQAVYNQSGLTAHNYVQVDFDLYIHDTWDGNNYEYGPDVWKMSVNGSNVINTTFSNFSYRDQAYPNNTSTNNPAFSSSLSSSLVNACNFGGGAPSSKYHISKIVPHTSSSLQIVLEAMGLENICNESWSIDNFAISLGVSPGPASAATWNGGAVSGVTTCNVDVSPATSTGYTTTIGTCTSPLYTVNIIPVPVPTFTLSNTFCSKTVSFSNTNIEVGATYVWNFGDGSADFAGNTPPSHLYSNGNYTVTLTASFGTSCSVVTSQSVSINDAPVAAISFVGGTGCGSTIQFSSMSTIPNGSTPTYLWNFGEVIPTTSTQQNPLKTYAIDGNYTVSLSVTTGLGCSNTASTTVNAIAVIGGNEAIFSATVSGACGNFISTVNSSTGTGNVYAWDFGDGSTSNEFAPTHYYISDGSKTISLTITNGVGCASSASQVVSISDNIGANGRIPLDFVISPSASQALIGNKFDFTPTYINNPSNNPPIFCNGSPTWNFGDATSSNFTNIQQKSYSLAGTYTVSIVQLTTNTGCFAGASKIVTVIPTPPLLQAQNIKFDNTNMKADKAAISTSVNNFANQSFAEISLFPNPNKGTFKVLINNLKTNNGDLIIVDMIGREVYKTNYKLKSNNDVIEINGLNLAPGTYNVILNSNNTTISRKSLVIITE